MSTVATEREPQAVIDVMTLAFSTDPIVWDKGL